jgi:hypothetical protein
VCVFECVCACLSAYARGPRQGSMRCDCLGPLIA